MPGPMERVIHERTAREAVMRQAEAMERIADGLEKLLAHLMAPVAPVESPPEEPPPVDNEHVAEGAELFDKGDDNGEG